MDKLKYTQTHIHRETQTQTHRHRHRHMPNKTKYLKVSNGVYWMHLYYTVKTNGDYWMVSENKRLGVFQLWFEL